MNQPWKLVLLLVGIFIAGGVTGALVTVRVGREMAARRPMPEQWAPNHLKRLGERLDLKPEQMELLRPIVRRNMDDLKRLRSDSMAETKAVFERMDREISEQLTPEQRAKFEQMNREFRERAKKFLQERPSRPLSGPVPPAEKPPGR